MGSLRGIKTEAIMEAKNDGIDYKFVCPECGGTELQIAFTIYQCHRMTTVSAHHIGKDGHAGVDYDWEDEPENYLNWEVDAYDPHFYRCGDCGYEIEDDKGNRYISDEDFNKWIRKHTK